MALFCIRFRCDICDICEKWDICDTSFLLIITFTHTFTSYSSKLLQYARKRRNWSFYSMQ